MAKAKRQAKQPTIIFDFKRKRVEVAGVQANKDAVREALAAQRRLVTTASTATPRSAK